MEAEVSELRKSFADKQEQEQAMLQVLSYSLVCLCFMPSGWLKYIHIYICLQVLIRMEQEQKVAEDARIAAERDAADKKYAAQLLQVASRCSLKLLVLHVQFVISVKRELHNLFVPRTFRRSMTQRWQHFDKWRREL